MHILVSALTNFKGFPFGGTEALVTDLLGGVELPPEGRLTLAGLSSERDGYVGPEVREFGENRFAFVSLCTVKQPARTPIRLSMAAGVLRNAGLLRSLAPDVVYAHSPEIAAACALVLRSTPMVLHCHGIDNPLIRSRFLAARGRIVPFFYDRVILRPALASARRVLINADVDQFRAFEAQYAGVCSGQLVRIPPVVTRTLFRPRDSSAERQRLGLHPDSKVVVFVGRLERPKGVHVLLEAIEVLRKRYPATVMLVVGDGGYRRALEERSSSLNVEGNVRFLGAKSRPEIAALLSVADVFASASEREAISMALLEAQAVGVPGVVAGVGGASALIRDGWNGFIVSERTGSAIAEKIAVVFETGKAWSDRCVEVSAAFDASVIARRVLSELGTAAEGCGARSKMSAA